MAHLFANELPLTLLEIQICMFTLPACCRWIINSNRYESIVHNLSGPEVAILFFFFLLFFYWFDEDIMFSLSLVLPGQSGAVILSHVSLRPMVAAVAGAQLEGGAGGRS